MQTSLLCLYLKILFVSYELTRYSIIFHPIIANLTCFYADISAFYCKEQRFISKINSIYPQ